MRATAKLITIGIVGLLLVTLFIEVVVFYVNQAKIVSLSGLALETAVEMSSASLEDGQIGIAVLSSQETSNHGQALIDSLIDNYERYFKSMGENMSISYRTGASYEGTHYDYQLYLNRTMPSNFKIMTFDLYVNIDQTPSHTDVHSLLLVKTYFHSKIMRGRVMSGVASGQIYYKDTLRYNTATDR